MNALTSVVLVVATLAIALGLATVTASLAPTMEMPGVPMHNRPAVIVAADEALQRGLPGFRHDAPPPASGLDLTRAPTAMALPAVSSTGPWKSPLYAQNGVTLWDRIRVSLHKDRRAFLLGSAIQVHAPATAAIPTAIR